MSSYRQGRGRQHPGRGGPRSQNRGKVHVYFLG